MRRTYNQSVFSVFERGEFTSRSEVQGGDVWMRGNQEMLVGSIDAPTYSCIKHFPFGKGRDTGPHSSSQMLFRLLWNTIIGIIRLSSGFTLDCIPGTQSRNFHHAILLERREIIYPPFRIIKYRHVCISGVFGGSELNMCKTMTLRDELSL